MYTDPNHDYSSILSSIWINIIHQLIHLWDNNYSSILAQQNPPRVDIPDPWTHGASGIYPSVDLEGKVLPDVIAEVAWEKIPL